jgi:hypothetical protein
MAMRSSITYSSKKRRRRPILLIGGDKGGTGKSFGARTIAGFLRKHGYVVAGYDGDARNGHLSRYYSESLPVSRAVLRDSMGWTRLYMGWKQVADDAIIMLDLPGNVGDMIESEAVRLRLLGEKLDREIINIWVASEEEDSIWLLDSALKVADASNTIFWMNGRFGADPSKFELWNGSQKRDRFMADGGTEAFLPVLPIFTRTKIARARSPFHDVSTAQLEGIEEIDFDIWWDSVESALEPLAIMLGGRP